MLIADENGRFGLLICHSASHQPSIGHWSTPSGNSALYEIRRKGGVGTAYVSLELQQNASLSVGAEGVYRCTIPDEEGNVKDLFVWIHQRGYAGEV